MADENSSIIRVENVSMRFRMANDRVTSINEMVTKMLKRQVEYKDFWALKNVSFDVKRGEVIGLIGRNGAWKKYNFKDHFRNFKTNRRKRLSRRWYCADA